MSFTLLRWLLAAPSEPNAPPKFAGWLTPGWSAVASRPSPKVQTPRFVLGTPHGPLPLLPPASPYFDLLHFEQCNDYC